MRNLMIIALGFWALISMPANAQSDDAIKDVIGSQLEAFNDRDVEAAWTHASPFIKRLFGNSRNFGAMVERGYPMVWDNNDVRFLELRSEDGAPIQQVMLKDAQGNLHLLEYKMIETPQGWQIDGVQLVELDLSA